MALAVIGLNRDHAVMRIRFSLTHCKACPLKARCTRSNRRHLTPRRLEEHEALVAARAAVDCVLPSVGRVGDSYDDALTETIDCLYKTEVIHRRGPWRSFEAVELATLEWVDGFNNRPLFEPIGNIPPAEAEARYHAHLRAAAIAQ